MNVRPKTRPVAEAHREWLAQVETQGPFLSLPVVKDIWPQGVERLGDADDRLLVFKQEFATWLRAYDEQAAHDKNRYAEVTQAWVETLLDDVAGWAGHRIATDELPAGLEVISPGHQVTIRATGGLRGREDEIAALLRVVEPRPSGLHTGGFDGWSATEIDRMSMLLRKAGVPVGLVTDGQWWSIVWAADGKPTGSGTVNALTWAEEPLLRDAFFALVDQRRFRAKDPEQRLARLLERSELEAEEITETLGTQVRKSVELLVQAFSEQRIAAARQGDPDPLTDDAEDVYQAAVTIMMRVVFLLFAEERGMLPTEQLYWNSYAVKDLLDGLQERALDEGEEVLDESYDVWHRLLAVSEALHGGVNYDEMRMPAYGGSLLDPDRFPWLTAADQHGLRMRVSDRVMLHVLESVQVAKVKGEARRISFRDVDVEQIGYIYEGLLGYTCRPVEDEAVIGLIGKDGEEAEIGISTLQEIYDTTADAKSFSTALLDWIKETQPGSAKSITAAKLAKQYDAEVDEAELNRLLRPITGDDDDLLGVLVSWGNYIRRDLRGIPYVVPAGGLVVAETPSRKNAGAHYTPRSLAEEVVLHALEPLVYEPGPLQTNDEGEWKLKSSTTILDLKVADIAAGSGAFLVAAARYLGGKVLEARIHEGFVDPDPADLEDVERDAIREVIARCLYGADINAMAVEMCKLSLWLVSLDKSKPFSFVDDKVFCGNSLLGVTSLDQLRYLHIDPKPSKMEQTLLVDVDAKIAEATRLRKELATPVEEHDPVRSREGKQRLLRQVHEVTADLRLIADGIIAAGLPLGGKPGRALDDSYKVLGWEVSKAFPSGDLPGDRTEIEHRIGQGLIPTAETDYERWQPLHWAIEAPDVVLRRGGFDAVIGNPPFLGGKRISGAMGTDIREWAVNVIARGVKGNADLVAYFLLRAVGLMSDRGTIGLVATNTVAQGDTREVGLDSVTAEGVVLIRAIQSAPWPAASANLEFAAIWGTRQSPSAKVRMQVDGIEVPRISTLLEGVGRASGLPMRLRENAGVAFIGCLVLGTGFIVPEPMAKSWLTNDVANQDCLFPYLTGEDLNSRPDSSASRWVIDFNELPASEAKKWPELWQHLHRQVRPERMLKDASKYPRMVNEWWKFWNSRPGLRAALSGQDSAIVISRVTSHLAFQRVSSKQVFSDRIVVITESSDASLAILSSSVHIGWAQRWGATLETRSTYPPSDVFETFPRPPVTSRLGHSGRVLHAVRREIMARRSLGLTSLYNLVNNSEVTDDPDVNRMREVYVETDEAVLCAYGWNDVDVEHGFYPYRGVERFALAPSTRLEILDRLLELNHERARAEGQDVPVQGELLQGELL
jgi:hypothetical protein